MAQPSSRSTLIDYCKRQLGAPLLEINIADEQTEDLLDDAIQYFQERHFNGVIQTFLKYKVRQVDIDRARGRGGDNAVGIVTTTTSTTIVGVSTEFSFEEDSNYLVMPNSVIGVNKLFHFDGANTVFVLDHEVTGTDIINPGNAGENAIKILAKPLSLIKSFKGTIVKPVFLTSLLSFLSSLLLSKSFLLPRGRWLNLVPNAYSSIYILTTKSSPFSLNSQKLSLIEALLLRIDLISVPVNTIPAVN